MIINLLRSYLVILKSGFFDEAFYLINYPDVRHADIDALMHFVRFGWREGRNPSAKYDIRYYLECNPDVLKSGINPLIHYLTVGRQEGRSISPVKESGINKYPVSSPVSDSPTHSRGKGGRIKISPE